jgi:hypothetical protein
MPYIGKKPADIIATAVDTTTGTFSGDIDVDGTTNLDVVDIDGALTQDGGAVFNEGGADVDFRVESDTIDHALFVDGASGNVGIGTSSPSSILHLSSTLPILSFTDTDDSATSRVYQDSESFVIDVDNANAKASSLFKVHIDNTERMCIESSGEVGINESSPGAQLHITSPNLYGTRDTLRLKNAVNANGGYFIRFVNYLDDIAGYIEQTGAYTVAYRTSSDHRLKENVDYTFDATTRLKQLKPCRFNFIENADTTVDGFLAHEVQSVVPEAIGGTHNEVDDDGNPKYQGIDQSKLIPLLTKAMQEQQVLIEALTARIKALEGA